MDVSGASVLAVAHLYRGVFPFLKIWSLYPAIFRQATPSAFGRVRLALTIYALCHLMPLECSISSIIQAIAAPGVGRVQLYVILLAISILVLVEFIIISGKAAFITMTFN